MKPRATDSKSRSIFCRQAAAKPPREGAVFGLSSEGWTPKMGEERPPVGGLSGAACRLMAVGLGMLRVPGPGPALKCPVEEEATWVELFPEKRPYAAPLAVFVVEALDPESRFSL